MSNIKLKKGLDIKLKGKAYEKISEALFIKRYALMPNDYRNLTPKLDVKIDDKVKAGSAVFHDKNNPQVLFTSPVSGTIENIVFGDKRKILCVIIKKNDSNEFEQFNSGNADDFTREQIIEQLLKSGLWTKIVRRPYGIIPKIDEMPKHIHISTFDSAPLAPNYNFSLKDNLSEFQAGVDILAKLTDGKVHVNLDGKIADNIFANVKNAEIHSFLGVHPVGNVGVQIHHTTPIVVKTDVIWTVNPQDVVFIGRLFTTGKLDLTKNIAFVGSEVSEPQYFKVISGCHVTPIAKTQIKNENVRFISGNVLSGTKIDKNCFLNAFDNQITFIPEGNNYEMLGWAKPGLKKYSVYGVFLSKICKNKEWVLNSNLHGGKRTFVLTGKIDKFLPMDIFPTQLLKAAITDDINLLDKLGIYEVIEEDIALCEFASETKMDFQEYISKAINLMIKEVE